MRICFLRAVWYDAKRFPSYWRLDLIEGPGRVRCRLQQFHLDVDEKYLMEENCGKSESAVLSQLVKSFQLAKMSTSNIQI